MTTNYTAEQRAADAEIALAMGWRWIPLTYVNADQSVIVPPDWSDTKENQLWFLGQSLDVLLPRFHTSHDARAALLEWLAADEVRWQRFDDEYFRLYPVEDENDYCRAYQAIRAAFLAAPDQVAAAALRVIREGEK